MIEKVATFKGQKLTDMSKEKLVEALELACNLREIDRLEHKRQLEFLGNFREQRDKGFFHRIFRFIFG